MLEAFPLAFALFVLLFVIIVVLFAWVILTIACHIGNMVLSFWHSILFTLSFWLLVALMASIVLPSGWSAWISGTTMVAAALSTLFSYLGDEERIT